MASFTYEQAAGGDTAPVPKAAATPAPSIGLTYEQLASPGSTPAQRPEGQKAPVPPAGGGGSAPADAYAPPGNFLGEVTHSMTFGLDERVAAGLNAILDRVIEGKPLDEGYSNWLDLYQTHRHLYERKHPLAGVAGQALGAIASGAATPGLFKAIPGGAGLAAKGVALGRNALAGAAVGAAAGAGASEGGAKAALKGAEQGAAFGAGGEIALPALGRAARKLLDAGDKAATGLWAIWTKNIQPELFHEEAFKAEPYFAAFNAAKMQAKSAIIKASRAQTDWWRGKSEKEQLAFINAVQTGTAPVGATQAETAYLQTQAGQLRKELDEAFKIEASLGAQTTYRKDYLPHIFEKPDAFRAWMQSRIKALGPKWFTKERSFDLLDQAIAEGFKPKTTNPRELVNMRLMASVDMQKTMELLGNLRSSHLAFRNDEVAHADMSGWKAYNAPDGKQWWVAPAIQPLFYNAVEDKGLWGNPNFTGDVFRGAMSLRARYVAAKLALSLFHPVHVLNINMAENLTQAFDALAKGKDLSEAFAATKRAFSVPIRAPKLGREALQAWEKPYDSLTPSEKYLVDRMTEGGFQPAMSEEYKIRGEENWAKAMQGNLLRLPLGLLDKTLGGMNKLIFEKWIPGLKATAYMNEVNALLKRNPQLMLDRVARGMALRQIAKAIDNRFGEMSYNTLFWNKTVKDLGQASFLSMSWNLGFVREFGGGLAVNPLRRFMTDNPSEAEKIIRLARNNSAFSTLYIAQALAFGGLMTYALTGKGPQTLLDYIYPLTGELNPNGTPHRLSTPFFTREYPQLTKHIDEEQSIFAGLAAAIGQKTLYELPLELLRGTDFYGRDITDINAPWLTQQWQRLRFAFGEMVPIVGNPDLLRTGKKLFGGKPITAAEVRDSALSIMGFGPAPMYASKSGLDNRIDFLCRRYVEPESKPYAPVKEQAALRDAREQVMNAFRSGDQEKLGAAILKAYAAGVSIKTLRGLGVPADIVLFKALPWQIQQGTLLDEGLMDEKDFLKFFPNASRKARVGALSRFQSFMKENPSKALRGAEEGKALGLGRIQQPVGR